MFVFVFLSSLGLPREQFAHLDKQMVDVVALAMGRFIDATDKGEWKKERGPRLFYSHALVPDKRRALVPDVMNSS